LACGKGEMLCQYAARHGTRGVGIDIHPPFIDMAKDRAAELGVAERLEFRVGDAGTNAVDSRFEVVSCIGATWIGGGFSGTVELMKRSLASDGCLLVGEVFLESEPPPDLAARHQGTLRGIADLGGLLDQVEAAGLQLTEMVIASRDDWDRYSSRQWARAHAWLGRNPDHPDAEGIRVWTDRSRRAYLGDERSWLGWGVFVLRP
ncbi:MAG TPA: methyltransferase domain-containing protein, partial [Acidimicrobiales bacterium]|nr:methyltransferase domain-containing protein [Acidimicrobiales bacterium]